MPKRDLERIRELILEAVTRPCDEEDGQIDMMNELKPGDLYQLRMMCEAGLIEGPAAREGLFFVTNQGQDFYDAVKDKTTWESAVGIATRTGTWTLEAVVEAAKSIAVGSVTAVLATFLKIGN